MQISEWDGENNDICQCLEEFGRQTSPKQRKAWQKLSPSCMPCPVLNSDPPVKLGWQWGLTKIRATSLTPAVARMRGMQGCFACVALISSDIGGVLVQR